VDVLDRVFRGLRDDEAEPLNSAQAAFQASGEYWSRWFEATKRDLLAIQQPDGSWADLVGSNYATAMAAIILQLPNQYLPIMEN